MKKRNVVLMGMTLSVMFPINAMASETIMMDIDQILNESDTKQKSGVTIEFTDRLKTLTIKQSLKISKEKKKLASSHKEDYGDLYTNVGRVIKNNEPITNKPAGVNKAKKVANTKEYEGRPLELVRKYNEKNEEVSYLFKSGGKQVGWVSKDAIEIGQNDIAYIMREGDRLEDLSKKYDKSMEYLRLMNGLGEGEQPLPGTKVKLVLGITESSNIGDIGDVKQSTAPAKSVEEFINRISEDTSELREKYNILPSVIMAQAILESRNGTSGLATVGNNLFGIKGSYNGQSIVLPTLEEYGGKMYQVHAPFRKYPSWSESLEDHFLLLVQNSRYARVVGQNDYQLATMGLQEAGYATDSNYASKLNQIIAIYDLTRYDEQ